MTFAERARAAVASYWTAGLAWAVMSALHWRWLWRSAHAGDVLSAYGAGLVVLGVWVAARPYLRAGFFGMVVQQIRPGVERPLMTRGGPEALAENQAEWERRLGEALPGIMADVLAERVIAVVVVVIGTLLNGWGTPLARRWGLPV